MNCLYKTLVGGLHNTGSEGFNDFLSQLFPRLRTEVKHTGYPVRLVGYEGIGSSDSNVRFFGAVVDHIEDIPAGMIGLELCDNHWSVFSDNTEWQSDLTWKWRNGTIGEFEAKCPVGWGCAAEDIIRQFNITAHTYIAPDMVCDDEVLLVDYDPSWPHHYDEMANRIKKELGDIALCIEHYGSTAIPNMPAKPVIDILVEIPSFDIARERVLSIFDKPECEVWNYSGHLVVIVREALMGRRKYHIHLAPAGHQIWDGLIFRDYLRCHNEDAEKYANLKQELAVRHRSDREEYTDAKTAFVREIIEKASS